MTSDERSQLAHLETRLFGLPGAEDGGALGRLESRLDRVESKLDRWDGAVSMLKAGASLLGIGGIAAVIAALANMGRVP